MRISDWSSDVCSSDLTPRARPAIEDMRADLFDLGEFGRPARQHIIGVIMRRHADARLDMARQRGARDLGRTAPQRKHRRAAHRAVAREAELAAWACAALLDRSEEHTSELQSLMRISYA